MRAESIKIGATLALSGDGAEWGKNAQRGIELAIDQVNAHGGIRNRPLEAIFEDYRSTDFKLAAGAAHKFTAVDKVVAILTQWSGDAEVVWPIATRSKVVTMCIGPAADNLTEKSPYIFRVWPSDESLIVAVVKYALKGGYKRALIIGALDPYFSGLTSLTAKHWREESENSISVLEVEQRGENLAGIALQAKKAQPDIVFIHTSYDVEAILLKRLREIGLQPTIIGTQRSDDPSVIKVAGKSAEGLIFPQYSAPDAAFRSGFKSKFGDEPGAPAEYAYDAVMILADSMRRSNSLDSDSLRMSLLSVQNYHGASGMLSIDRSGNRVGKSVEIRVVKDGKGSLLEAN